MKTIIASLFLCLLLISPARATPVTWMLSDVTLDHGGTVSGSFIFDADAISGIGEFSNVSVWTSGYSWPILTSQWFTSALPVIDYSPGAIGLEALHGLPNTVNNCYVDPTYPVPAPCEFFSSLSLNFTGHLSDTAISADISNGWFSLQCAQFEGCPDSVGRDMFSDTISTGHVCTTLPCPGGPPIQVPEPSSLLVLGIGLLGLAAASKQCAIISADR